jgi:rubredoxin
MVDAQAGSSNQDFVEFARAGAAAEGEYHCSACGYGITVRSRLPICPMCAGTTWEAVQYASFARQRYQA